jgi:hypothetical protein
MWSTYQAASQYTNANAGDVSRRIGRRRSHAAIMAADRPSTSSGGAQSARITFWSRWRESSEVSAMCSSGESSATAMRTRPAVNAAIRSGGVSMPRRRHARTTTA